MFVCYYFRNNFYRIINEFYDHSRKCSSPTIEGMSLKTFDLFSNFLLLRGGFYNTMTHLSIYLCNQWFVGHFNKNKCRMNIVELLLSVFVINLPVTTLSDQTVRCVYYPLTWQKLLPGMYSFNLPFTTLILSDQNIRYV